MSYTGQDARRAAKELTAAMAQLHSDMRAVAERCGAYLGIMDSLNGAPMTGSEYAHKVDHAIGGMSDAYSKLREAITTMPMMYGR